MIRGLTLWMLALATIALPAQAQDAPEDKPAEQEVSAADALRANPGDTAAINKYMIEVLREVRTLMSEKKYDQATQLLNSGETLIGELSTDNEQAQKLLKQAQSVFTSYHSQVELAQTPIEELKTKAEENPDDMDAVSRYGRKVMIDVSPIVRSDPEQAEQQITDAKTVLASIEEKTTNESIKKQISNYSRQFQSYDRAIASAKKLLELIGQDAAKLDPSIVAWVNGDALTDADLQGKVVLLDFWAVWCGPCIATFPHLQEWNEKYADDGLVIVGITRYYNYKWDEDANRATRVDKKTEEIPADVEQQMLVKFAEQHELHHRFAIQSDNALSEYYGVSGIPQAVLIDRQGKIRLIRVGSGTQNAKDISEMLATLIEEKE